MQLVENINWHWCIVYFSLLPQTQLKNFMETTLGKIQNTESALMVLKQFERSVIWFGMKQIWHQLCALMLRSQASYKYFIFPLSLCNF